MDPSDWSPIVERYLRIADRSVPGRITGFYVVGSTALGAYRPDRSDIDFVAVVDGTLTTEELRRLRGVHIRSAARSFGHSLVLRQPSLPGTCNGVFVSDLDLSRPVSTITPLASHTGHQFHVGEGFDVNPVMWKVLAEHGVAVRGALPDTLGLDPEPHVLKRWNLDNLDAYWRPWAERIVAGGNGSFLRPGRWTTAWGVLGSPRLHCTIATGDVISKEAAGEYALDVFDVEWRPIIAEALAYWRGEPATAAFPKRVARNRRMAEFVLEVVNRAHEL